MVDLGAFTLGGTGFNVFDINDHGQIVGQSNVASEKSHAYLWTQKDGIVDLNTCLPPNSGWELSQAYAINNLGQIVGTGWVDLNGDGTFDTGAGTLDAEHAFLLTPIKEVPIDIKPEGGSNSINPKSKGTIKVAILSTSQFYAPDIVDKDSLTFGSTGDEDSLAFCYHRPEDINRDGLKDLICHFYTEDTGFTCGDTEGILKGTTKDGRPIQGSDSVSIAPCRNKKK